MPLSIARFAVLIGATIATLAVAIAFFMAPYPGDHTERGSPRIIWITLGKPEPLLPLCRTGFQAAIFCIAASQTERSRTDKVSQHR